MDWVDRPQNFKGLYGILQLFQGCHLGNFPLKTLKLGWVAFRTIKFQTKCWFVQCNQYKKLVPVLSHFWTPPYGHLVNTVTLLLWLWNNAITIFKEKLMQTPHLYSEWPHFWNLNLYNPYNFTLFVQLLKPITFMIIFVLLIFHVLIKVSLLLNIVYL